MKNIIKVLIVFSFAVTPMFSAELYTNDARKLFVNNNAIIYALNIRTFNAQDINNNGIIDFESGETSGNFTNAIERLDELKDMGVNLIHVLPITPIGKTKALGTAGSLYATSSFAGINEQLAASEEEVKNFVNEAHKRGIRVIIDLPACASYDLFLQRPELFVKDKDNQAIIPADWTDVRLLDAGNEDVINYDVLAVYREFIDMVQSRLGVDGIRADVAHCKPAKFWQELISYSRQNDEQFLWLAESSDSWHEAVSKYGVFTPYDKLLEAGFDGYYGSYFNLKNWKSASELTEHVLFNQNLAKQFADKKSVIGSFTTHDELSPMLVNGVPYSEMIIWLNTTLPLNAYYVDGFATGDNYIYEWANKKAQKSFTDDDYYFVHRGKIDIFNFSRKPEGDNYDLLSEFITANNFRTTINPILANGKFTPLATNNKSVYAYTITYQETALIVFGNMNFKEREKVRISIPGVNMSKEFIPIKIKSIPVIRRSKIDVILAPGEIEVLLLDEGKNNYCADFVGKI